MSKHKRRRSFSMFIAIVLILVISLPVLPILLLEAMAETRISGSFLSKYNGINSVVGNIVKWEDYDRYFACISDGYGINPAEGKDTLVSITTDGVVNSDVSGITLIASPGGQGYIFPNGVAYGNGNAGKRFSFFAVPNNNDLQHASFIEATNNTTNIGEPDYYQDIYHASGFSSGGGGYLSLRGAEDWKKIIHAASRYSQAGIFDNKELGTESFKGGIIQTSVGAYNNGTAVRAETGEGWGSSEDIVNSGTSIEGKLTHNGNNNTGTPGYGQRLNNSVANYNYIAVRLEEDWTATTVTGTTMLPVANKSSLPNGYDLRDISFGTSFEGDVNDYSSGMADTAQTVGHEQLYFMPSDSPFSFGRLAIPDFTYIILDLNGHTLDRGLTGENTTCITSQIFSLGRYSRLEIFDSSANKDNPHGNGKITGGNTGNNTEGLYNSNKGGAFWVGLRSELVIHSGTITGNSSLMGGCAYAPLNGTINIFDAYVTGNLAGRGGVTYGANGSYTVTNVFGGTFEGNASIYNSLLFELSSAVKATHNGAPVNEKDGRYSYGWGGAFAASINSFLNIYGGEISNNYCSAYGGGIYVANGSFVKLYGGTIKNNLSNFMGYTEEGYDDMSASPTHQVNDIKNGGGGIFLSQNAGGIYINGPAQVYDNHNLSVPIDSSIDTQKLKAGPGCDRINQAKKIKDTVKNISASAATVMVDANLAAESGLAFSNLYLADVTCDGSALNENNDGVHIYPEIKVQGYLSNMNGDSAKIYVTPAKGNEGGYIMRSFRDDGWSDLHVDDYNNLLDKSNYIPDGKNQKNVNGTYTFNDSQFLGDNVYGEYFYTDSGASLYQQDGWIYIRNIEAGKTINVTWQYLSAPGVWTDINADTPRVSVKYTGTDQIENIRAIFKSSQYNDRYWYLYATKFEIYDNEGHCQGTHTLVDGEKIFDIQRPSSMAGSAIINVGSFEFVLSADDIGSLSVDGMQSPNIDVGTGDSFYPASKTYRIDQADLTVKAKDFSIYYGYAAPKYELEFTSLLGADLAKKGEFEAKVGISCVYEQGNDASTYQITVSGTPFSNYKTTFLNGSLTVNKRKITLQEASITVDNKTYDGTNTATVHLESALFDNVYNNDQLTLTAESYVFVNKNAGDNINVEISGLKITGEKASNYELTKDSITKQASISKKDVNVLIESKSVEYLAPEAGFTYKVQDKLVDGDEEKDLGITLRRDGGNQVGKYTIHGESNSTNYNVKFTGGEEAYEIYKKAIAVPSVGNKTYNGELQKADVDGFEGKDTIFEVSKNNGGINAQTYEVEFKLIDTNYRWATDESGETLTATATFEILKASLRVSWSKLTLDYNATEQHPEYEANFVGSDKAKAYLLFDSVQATGKIDTGTYQVTLTLPDDLINNYNLESGELTQQFEIEAIVVGVSWQSTEFEYTGEVWVPVPEITGVLEADQHKAEQLYKYLSGNNYVNANASKDGTVFSTDYVVVIELDPAISKNYKIQEGQEQTSFKIKQAPLTVTWQTNNSDTTNESNNKRYVRWSNAESYSADYVYNHLTPKTAYSQDNNILVATLQGMKKSEEAPRTQIKFAGGDIPNAQTIGSANVTLLDDQGNYYIDDSTSEFTITIIARHVTVKIQDKEGVYGGTKNTKHTEGLKNGVELVSDFGDWDYEEGSMHFLEAEDENITFILRSSGSEDSEKYLIPGEYDIEGTFNNDSNYEVSFVGTRGDKGKFEITKATIKQKNGWNETFDYAGGAFGEHTVKISEDGITLAGDVLFNQASVTISNPKKDGTSFDELRQEEDYRQDDNAYVIWHAGKYTFDVKITAPYHEEFNATLTITISEEHIYVTLDKSKIKEVEYGTFPTTEDEINQRLKELFFNEDVVTGIEGYTGDIHELSAIIAYIKEHIKLSILSQELSTSGNLKAGTYSLKIEVDSEFIGDATISFKDGTGTSMLKVTLKQVSVQFGVEQQFEYKGDFRLSPTINAGDILSGDKVGISFKVNKVGKQSSTFNGEVGQYQIVLTALTSDDAENYTLPETKQYDFEITKKQVTIVIKDQTAVYDGQAKTVNQGETYWQLQDGSSFVKGEEVNIEIYCEKLELVNVGNYNLKARTNNQNYEIKSVGQDKEFGQFIITKRSITKPEIESKTYNGEKQVADIDDDMFTIEENAGGIDVGEYTVRIKIKDFANNKWQTSDTDDEVTLTFNITKATLTLQWSDTELQYNGGKQKPRVTGTFLGRDQSAYTVKVSDLNSENQDADGKKDVGSYLAELYLENLLKNYDLQAGSETSQHFSITAKRITVSGIGAQDKEYDGDTSAELDYAGVEYTGKVGQDELTVTAKGTFADKNVGRKQVTITEIKLEGTDAGNYILETTQLTTSAEITAKRITVSGIGAQGKEYDGNVEATLTYDGVEYSGKVAQDVLTVTAKGTFADKNVGSKQVTITEIELGGKDAGNYILETKQLTANAEITAKEITVSGITAKNKEYDGDTSAELDYNEVEFSDKVGSDIFTVTAKGTFADKNVGRKQVTITEIELGGTDARNYRLTTETLTASAEITAKRITVSGIGAQNKEYDGNVEATLTYEGVEYSGKVEQDVLTVTAKGTFADKNVGRKQVTITEIKLEGTDAGNYILETTQLTAMATISKLDIKLEGLKITKSKTYDGTDSVEFNSLDQMTLDGVIDQDKVTLKSLTARYETSNVGQGIKILFTYELDGADAGNYNLVIGEETAEITTAKLVVKANDFTIHYGDGRPEFSVTYEGFVNSEDKTNLGGELRFTCDYEVGSDATDYVISIEGYNSTNYSIEYKAGSLHVEKKDITVKIEEKESYYNQAEERLTYTYEPGDLVGDDTAEDLGISLSRDRAEEKDAGTYDIIGKSESKNYKVNFEGGEDAYTIKRAPVSVPTISPKTYNGELQKADVPEGFIAEVNDGGVDVGEYEVVLILDELNYEWEDEVGVEGNKVHLTFQIVKASNSFVQQFNLEDWIYGNKTGTLTMPEAQFGLPTINIYDKDGKVYTIEELGSLGPGEYRVIVTVKGTNNYDGLSAEYHFKVAQQTKSAGLWWIYVVVALVVLAILVFIIILLILKRRKKKETEEQ